MTSWTLSYATEIVAGLPVKAQHLLANFFGLKSDIDDRLSKVTNVPQTVVSNVTTSGTWTFNALAKSPLAPQDPNDVVNKAYVDQAIVVAGSGKGIHNSAPPVYVSTHSFSLAYVAEKNSTGTVIVNTPTTVDTNTTGLNGLDTGAFAANDIGYLYAIAKPDGTSPGLIVSKTDEHIGGMITLPAGYAGGAKIQMPFYVLLDGSVDYIFWTVGEGWPIRPTIHHPALRIATGATGASGTITAYLPTVAQRGFFNAALDTVSITSGNELHSNTGDGGNLGAAPAGSTIPSFWNLAMTNNQLSYILGDPGHQIVVDQIALVVTEV